MKKLLSFLSLILLLNNIFVFQVFAGLQIDFQLFQIKVNDGTNITGDLEVRPGDKIGLLLSGQNSGDIISNPRIELNFSNTNFTYNNSGLKTYLNNVVVYENIPTSTFNPGVINTLPLATTANSLDYMDAYRVNLFINQNTPNNVLTINSKISADGISSNQISRNVFINSNPHITNYYFKKSGVVTTQLTRGGGDNIDFFIEIKDYNGCDNIDSGVVTANLSSLGLSTNEVLSFDSCNSNVALYKKASITTLTFPGTIAFTYTDFSVTDESGNVNKPNDTQTTFDNEDKKDSISLEIVSAGTPVVNLSIDDDYIGGTTNQNTNITISGNQNGEYKLVLGDSGLCDSGITLIDWTTGYLAFTDINYSLNSSNLADGSNSIFACFQNDEFKIGSSNGIVTKDIINPTISTVSATPGNVTSENSNIKFTCSENGEFQIAKGGTGTINSGIFVGSGVVISNTLNTYNLDNALLDLDANDIYIFCLDGAENYASQNININKTIAPPSFVGGVTNFADNDIDFDGLDGRDIFVEWDNTIGIAYSYFESYRLYILPNNSTLDEYNDNYLYLNIDNTNASFLGGTNLTKDSHGNNFVSGSQYKACISIMGTNGLLGTPGCVTGIILTSDTVTHPVVTSAKFTSDTNLEITTDATLDTNINSHSGSLISYTYNGSTYTGNSINSIVGKKINVTIDSLSKISAIGTNLLLSTGAIRAEGGGFNDDISFASITDGQIPTITGLINNTISSYNTFFTGSINLSFTFGEDMKASQTKIEITRFGGNLDSNTYTIDISGANLLKGTNNKNVDLSALNLVDGTNYQFRIIGQDLAGNFSSSNIISNIKYDSVGPDIVIKNVVPLYSTLTPNLTWIIPIDNLGNGSGIKKYRLDVYNGVDCIGSINQSHTPNTNSQILNTLGNIANYSWKVVAIDNMENIGISSICNNFRVDISIPSYSNFSIEDTTISSTSYFMNSDSIKVTSNIINTDINHIWLDLSQISGNVLHNNELCSTPSIGIICTYIGNIVTYIFNAGALISDGVKQVQFNTQNTSGGNDTQKIISITADSTNPVVANDALLTPIGLVGSLSTPVTWNTFKISDNIGLDHIKVEYSTGAGLWHLIGTSPNNGLINWDLTSIVSGADYKIQLTAYDLAGNTTSNIFPIFEIDRTVPVVPSNTIIFPNGGEIFGSNGIANITWNSGSITDANLAANPIGLFYSIDGSIWNSIASNLINSGTYNWTHPIINSETVKIKLQATDSVGNISSDVSNNSFIIDTTDPLLSINFSSTPVDGNYINNSGFDILGNTSDLHFKTNSYIFKNLTTGEYFNGTIFTGATEILNNICSDPINNGTNNSCDLISFNLLSNIINGNNYRLQLKSIDEAGNELLTTPINYIGDIINPDVSILTSSGTYFKDSIQINGTSSDLGSGISSVKIQIKKGSDYWNGTDFVTTVQTLNTETLNNYTNWTYDFAYNGDDGEYEVIAIAFDKSFKVNNHSENSIIVNKDTTPPNIIGGVGLFTSPVLGSIYIGGEDISILWNSGSITDLGAGLKDNPIMLEYFDGTEWKLISDNELNDGNYLWVSEFLDSNIVKIRLSAFDKVENISSKNSNSFTIDSTPPSISSVETMDLDADGQIDALNIIMSEDIQDSSIVLGDFSISDGIGIPTSYETGNSVNDENFILKFGNIGDTALRPSISYVEGSLKDKAGKIAETDLYTLSLDKASPRLLYSEIYDIDGNGKFDKITSTFSENLNFSSDITALNIVNSLDGISIDSVATSGNKVNIFLNEGTNYVTSVGSMSLNFTSNSNWKDLNNNQAGSIINGTINDKAKPVAYNAEYFDLNSNYKVDKVIINFSETVEQFNDADFTFSGLIKNTGTLLGNRIEFSITETLSDNDTGIDAYYSFISGNLKDQFDNFTNNITNFSINDKVEPKLISIETNDYNGNGKIDNIKLTYSEDINSDFTSFIGDVDSYNISGYIKGTSKEILIQVDEKNNYDSGDTPLVRIISNNNLSDLNGNLLTIFAFINSIDKVGPVIIGARYDEALHKIFLQSSEIIDNADFLVNSFILNNAGAYSVDSVNVSEKSITISGESITYGSTKISFTSNTMGDSLGNKQTGTYYTKLSPPIIINEIMISDNSANNYIELKNLSSSVVNISNFTIAGVTIPASTNIGPNGYYLISKDSEANSIINIVPDLIAPTLNISGANIALNNGIINIDFANLTTGFADTVTPKSIERKDNAPDGLLVSSWYTAQKSDGFDDLIPFGTPGILNVFDATAPTITNYTPNDNILLSNGNLNISIDYSDDIGGLGIDLSSDNILLKKWDGSTWGADIASTYLNFPSKIVTSTEAIYQVNDLEYGKYRINFSISDKAGNVVNKIIIFYVDEFTFSLSTDNIEIGKLISGFNNFSTNEVIFTVETVGAGFSIDMLKNGNFTNFGTDIIDWNGATGFGFDLYNSGYSGDITSMGLQYEIVNEVQNINIDGNKNIFTYKIKYGANINITQGAGIYTVDPRFEFNTIY